MDREWIPISNKLPTSDGRFEVTLKGSKGKRRVEMCNFYSNAGIDSSKWGGKYEQVNVIAWRERDKPYHEM